MKVEPVMTSVNMGLAFCLGVFLGAAFVHANIPKKPAYTTIESTPMQAGEVAEYRQGAYILQVDEGYLARVGVKKEAE